MDPFRTVPTEVRKIILENLDLPSLYSATRAFLSLAKTFNGFPAGTLEAVTCHYRREVQQCIRMAAALPSKWVEGMSYKRFKQFYIHGPAKNRSFPFSGISAAEAHDVLKCAWRVHWIVRACLDDMIQVSATHYGKSLELVKLPAFPSWVEEQRVLRAVWRLQICIMLESTGRFRPEKVKFDSHQSYQIWKHLPVFEQHELFVIIHYARRALERPESFWPRDWAKRLESRLFSEEMVQSSWVVVNLAESTEDWLSGREESHLQLPGRGLRVPIRENEGPPLFWLKSGIEIWDKDRLRRLGLDVCAFNCRLEHWHNR